MHGRTKDRRFAHRRSLGVGSVGKRDMAYWHRRTETQPAAFLISIAGIPLLGVFRPCPRGPSVFEVSLARALQNSDVLLKHCMFNSDDCADSVTCVSTGSIPANLWAIASILT
ncbi:hypothetical protein PsYK624_099640 [Phanerochaete sordida]|uniref:Uncharacterized protein n=1 Tax=Phanerochaete sordida TaxID=48140 RepID=A0A9P3GDQ5_9APHY|nr:hypothetical protein PsYK624_099640 [Phanerochaete sordida]